MATSDLPPGGDELAAEASSAIASVQQIKDEIDALEQQATVKLTKIVTAIGQVNSMLSQLGLPSDVTAPVSYGASTAGYFLGLPAMLALGPYGWIAAAAGGLSVATGAASLNERFSRPPAWDMIFTEDD